MYIKILPKSEFSRSVLTLMTGATVAQAIPILVSPILTRLYSPSDFGILSLFVSIVTIFGAIVNGRYELAIMLPKKEEDAINVFALSIVIAFFISLLLMIIVVIFHNNIISLLNNKSISLWLYFMPFVILLVGIFNSLNYYHTRKKDFKLIAKSNVLKTMMTAIIQVGLGIINVGVSGLISGRIFLYIIANIVFLKNVLNRKLFSLISFPRMKVNFLRYINFLKYSMGANLANTLSYNLINILISLFYSVSTLGLYSLVNRVLSMPMALIGRSYGQVFYQKATEEKNMSGSAKVIFNRTYKRLTLVSIIIGLILFFSIKDAFAIIFGEQWRIAGYYCQILLPLFLVRFIVSPISIINSIFEKQKISLYWQIGLLILTLSVFTITKIMDLSFVSFLYYFTWITASYYTLLFFILKKIASGK